MEVVLLLVLLAVLIAGGTLVMVVAAVTTRRRGGPELEPPPAKPARPRRVGEPPAPSDELVEEVEEALAPAVEPEVVAPPVKPTFRDRLAKARSVFSSYVGSILDRPKVDQETWDDLEEALIRADVGVGAAGE